MSCWLQKDLVQLIISELYLAWDMTVILVYASCDEHKCWFDKQYYKKIFVAILFFLAFYVWAEWKKFPCKFPNKQLLKNGAYFFLKKIYLLVACDPHIQLLMPTFHPYPE